MKLLNVLKSNDKFIVVCTLLLLSLTCSFYFVSSQQNLLYGDALSRLDISRKVFDNLNPGLAQLGNVWLPLPQLLMTPFITNNFLWHSGIAGAIPSMIAFIIGGYFIYKATVLLARSNYAGIFALLIYALNINLLYLQTTAMSEAIFISLLSAVIYYSIHWSKTGEVLSLVFLAFCITLITLTRYEGLAILASSIIFVLFYSIINNKSRAESNTIIFTVLACLGFTLWTIYLTMIFGDPLYWRNYYTAPQVTTENVEKVAEGLSFLSAIFRYFTSLVWMNGLIPISLAFIGLVVFIYDTVKRKIRSNVALLIPFSIYLFMVLTLQRNTPIQQPDLLLSNILSSETSKIPEFNIRYGLILLPLVSILAAYLLKGKSILLKTILTLIFFIQVATYFYPQYSIIYQLPIQISGNDMQGVEAAKLYIKWFNLNYDGGKVMVSALKHDPQMFQSGLNYKTFIHEGTGKYWKESIKDPSKYASWVIFYYNNPQDQVTKFLKDSKILNKKYDLVYNQLDVRIYKIKDKSSLKEI